MLQRWKGVTSLFFARFTYNLADSVDEILESASDSTERDKALRKLLAKHAPCPVEGVTWSLINAIDFDFTGFSGKHLSDHVASSFLLNAAHIDKTPNLLVLRDLGLASKLAYEDPKVIMHICQTWKMETAPEFFFSSKDAQAFMMYDQQNIVLSFRGTELINPKDWSVNLKINLVPMNAHAADGANPDEASTKPLAHNGFLEALGLVYIEDDQCLYSKLCATLNLMHTKEPNRKLWVTGHSQGGAIASIFVAQLLLDNDELLDSFAGLYTYGQPRCGNAEYRKLFSDLKGRGLVYRSVNKKDLIPKVPMKMLGYSHHGCKLSISKKKLKMLYKKGENVEVKRTQKVVLPPNSGLKKLVFALIPESLEDHYPSEYVRNMQLFI